MMSRFSFLMLICFVSSAALAHDERSDPAHPQAHMIPAAIERTLVKITQEGTYRYIESNGIPNHQTGQFPNRANPNSISAQSHKYRVPVSPSYKGQAASKDGVIGVALNGIPFEPGTAECYGLSRGQKPQPGQKCEWSEEAIVKGEGQLGLDSSNAHVQPDGTYHYHGVPNGLVVALAGGAGPLHVGYAADGFKMMVSINAQYKSGWGLKSGARPVGAGSPGGRYDGTYTADYEYIGGSGMLDQCNGTELSGEYVYFITNDFPFAPRCLMAAADSSFARKGSSSGSGSASGQGAHPPRGGRPVGKGDFGGRRPPPPRW